MSIGWNLVKNFSNIPSVSIGWNLAENLSDIPSARRGRGIQLLTLAWSLVLCCCILEADEEEEEEVEGE